jgi:uncharacterized membrane protein YhhN
VAEHPLHHFHVRATGDGEARRRVAIRRDRPPSPLRRLVTAAVWFTAAAVLVLLALEAVASRWRLVAKMLASSGFIAVALLGGTSESSFGRCIPVGLALSWSGDLLLGIPRAFLGGLAAFLLAHVAYSAGFLVRGTGGEMAVAGLVVIVSAAAAWRWLRPHLDDGMRTPVAAYVVVISVMVILSVGAASASGDWRIALGAAAFFLSDLAVARDRFVSAGIVNRVWGLPLYYAGQVLLALAAGG